MKRETCNVTDYGLSYRPSEIEPIFSTCHVTERNTAIKMLLRGILPLKNIWDAAYFNKLIGCNHDFQSTWNIVKCKSSHNDLRLFYILGISSGIFQISA